MIRTPIAGVLLWLAAAAGAGAQSAPDWLLASAAPANLQGAKAPPVIVAIVDDGFRVGHRELAPFLWRNPAEIAGNGIDDDGNGYVDDSSGWDVSDGDPLVAPPVAAADRYFHGTHLAGIVTRMARRAYGARAPDHVRILPVKVLGDADPSTGLRDAYRGLRYAAAAGAHVVLAAWGQGAIAEDDARLLRELVEQDLLVVASAGNFADRRPQFPAAAPGVLAVAAIDEHGSKLADSNLGAFVDLAAPGREVTSASVVDDVATEARSGTSFAAAMVAATAALVKAQQPHLSMAEVADCLVSSAAPLAELPPDQVAALGAGRLDAGAAVQCAALTGASAQHNLLVAPRGVVSYRRSQPLTTTWRIAPQGVFSGLRFDNLRIGHSVGGGTLQIASAPGTRPLHTWPLRELPAQLYVPGTTAFLTFEPDSKVPVPEPAPAWRLAYRAEPIDYSTRYCRDTVHLRAPGTLEDGSGAAPYSLNTDCKWLIEAPPGQVVKFRFAELNTEPVADKLYFFDGDGTQARIMAVYSGTQVPPELTTWRNQVLVWFVTDGVRQGDGWRATFEFLDATP